MDTNKLLELLQLLEADENEFGFGNKINELSSFIGQNNEDGNKQADEKLASIETDIKISRAAQFSGTEIEALKNLKADEFFGIELVSALHNILNNTRGYAIQNKLNQFKTDRATKYSGLVELKNSMTKAGVTAYKQSNEEVGLSLPNGVTEVDQVSVYLKNFGRFINAVQDCSTTGNLPRAKITRLNKGSLQFFASVDPAVAENILHCLGDLSVLYLTIKDIRGKKDDPVLEESEQEEVAQIYEKAVQRKTEEFITNTVNKICTSSEEAKKSELTLTLKTLLQWMPKGIRLEVIFKKTIAVIPKDAKGEVDASQLRIKEEKAHAQLQISEMYKLPPEQLKLPDGGEDSGVESE